MKPCVAQAVKIVAQFHFFTYAAQIEKKHPITKFRIPLLVSLYALDFPVQSVKSATSRKSLASIAAHVHVRYGPVALNSLYFWQAFQYLRSVLKNGFDPNLEDFRPFLDLFSDASEDVGVASVIREPVDTLVTTLTSEPLNNPDTWTQALSIMDVEIEPVVSRHLGIASRLMHGMTDLVGVSYGEVYRLAIHSGTLRGLKVASDLIEESSHEKDRCGHEFYKILERLGVTQSIPRGMRSIRRALNSLLEKDISVSTQAISNLFLWLETYLEIIFGGHTNTFHRIAYDAECLRLFLLEPEEFSPLIGETSNNLFEQLRPFDGTPVESIQESIGEATRIPVDFERCNKESESIKIIMRAWLRSIVPKDKEIKEMNDKIFLSHKSVNRPLVRQLRDALGQSGFRPWMDEDEMPAGDVPLRAIHRGLEESCAAVFFITPDFQDERWLSEEIDYALDRKRQEGDRFRIITLVFRREGGPEPVVPSLLRRYVYKEPASELEALKEIIRALPIKPGPTEWK